MSTVDKNKQYTTRNGLPVEIYATDRGGQYPVHGAICSEGVWYLRSWTKDGFCLAGKESLCDLIEVKPRIQRTYYINVYNSGVGGDIVHCSRKDADKCAMSGRLACIEITIDCEEGEGL